MKRASYSCNFLCVVLAAAYLKYRRCRLSCLPFVWYFFSLWHTHTHTHAHTRARAHIHPHTTHTHTHTHTHSLSLSLSLSLPLSFSYATRTYTRHTPKTQYVTCNCSSSLTKSFSLALAEQITSKKGGEEKRLNKTLEKKTQEINGHGLPVSSFSSSSSLLGIV